MSFLRPTKSSLRRAKTTLEAQPCQTVSVDPSPSTIGAAQPLHARPVFHETPVPDYSHVPSRVDSGLHSRVQTSSLTRRRGINAAPADLATRSPSLREFATKCDHVIQRAQELLDRTREQELFVAKALEERLSQSPGRRADTPTPPLSQGDAPPVQQQQQQQQQQTPTRWFGGFSSPAKDSPAVPAAPHTTPVAPTHLAQEEEEEVVKRTPTPTSPSPSRHGLGGWLGLRAPSPSLPPLPAPPPTPAAPARSSPVSGPATATTGSTNTADESDSQSSPSLLQRIRRSLQRTPHGGVDASPAPLPPHVAPPTAEAMQNISSYNVYGAGRPVQASPRKSVRFVSPDKLENVTPTKVVIFADAESSCSEEEVEESEEEEEEEEEAARTSVHRPPSKKARVETSQSTTPKRDSVVLPPAPPPSAVKSPSGKHGDCSPGSRSSSTSPPSPSGASQRTHSPDSSPRVSHGSRTSASSRSSSAESPQSARTYTMHHDELKAYVMQHTIRQSLACLTKREMKVFLKEEGSSLATQHHVLKKHLLTEIRALIRKQAEA